MAVYLIFLPLLIGVFFLWRFSFTRNKGRQRDETLVKPLQPLIEAFEKGQSPDKALIADLCKHDARRLYVWMLLDARERLDLFPEKYKTQEAGAISNLCYWIGGPNELGESPDTIELWEKVTLPAPGHSTDATYYVFKFGMNAPHWLAKSGLRAGVAGPYFPETGLYAATAGTFSRFDPIGDKSAEGHATWVHEEKVVKAGAFEPA